jgi:RND family efflux transporter MFP subunit
MAMVEKSRNLLLLALALPVALLASCGGDSPASARAGGGARDGGARPVRLVRAEEGRLARTVEVSGTLAADAQAALGMKVAGRIASLPVDIGSRVAQGQMIARLSPIDFELRVRQAASALEQARARLGLKPGAPDAAVDPEQTAGVRQARAVLKQSQLTRDRAASLFEQQLISRSDLDAAEANLAVADSRLQDAVEEARNRQGMLAQRRSELDLARQQLADSTLTAPFDGAIRERRGTVGDYVAVGQVIAVLVRVHPLRLRLAVPEREAAGVRAGQPVRLTVEGDPATYTGEVAHISPAISEDNRTLLVEAEVPNRDGRLRPGSFARAEIVTRAAEPAVLVPASALVTFAGVDKVIGVAGGRATEMRVRTGRRAGGKVEILDGVAAGEPVVVEPGNLTAGEPVRVVP